MSSGSLHALPDGVSGGNGVFLYGGGFPTGSFNATNYWVDVVFTNFVAPTITATTPAANATNVALLAQITAAFSLPIRLMESCIPGAFLSGIRATRYRPALLPVALVLPALDRMERRFYQPLRPTELPQWRRQWILWRAARKGLAKAF